jgi:hypothetical protein
MLKLQSWLPQAEALDIGRRARVNHDCGPGRTLLISRSHDGYRGTCFRCNDSGWAAGPQESLAERALRLAALHAQDMQLHSVLGVELPEPAVQALDEWPDRAKLWLYKAGLGRDLIGRLGAYYHPPSDRVVLPVLDPSTGLPVFWQARAVDNRQPKYMAPSVDRSRVLPRYGAASSPTLTEDILSAFKVGLVGEGWAVMGTKLSTYALNLLMERGTTVNVWLDADAAGVRGANKIMRQLQAFGIPCRNIVSDRDPKLHSRQEIQELLCES